MPNSIDNTGLNIVGYQELRDEKSEEFKNEFGEDIKTDVESAFGQMISLAAQSEYDLTSLIATMLTAFDPNAAQGVLLERLAIIMNKRRNEAVKSTVSIDITTDTNGATIPVGFIVGNDNGIEFITTSSQVLAPSTTTSIDFEAIEDGPIVASAATLTIIKTPIFGITTANNPSDASIGRSIEDYEDLRVRMLRSSSDSNGTTPGIITGISEVDGVSFVNVIENNTNVAFANGQKEHTVFPIIEGGADADIAESLITKGVAGGIGYVEQGDIVGVTITSATFTDTVSAQVHTAHWARPVDKQVFCKLEIKKLADYPANGSDLIKAAINDWVSSNAVAGETFYSSFLYNSINSIGGLVINTVFIGEAVDPVTVIVTMGDVEKASIAIADIALTEVV